MSDFNCSTYNMHRRFNETAPTPTLWTQEFSLADRVALVSGGHGGLGLDAALALVEAGARAVYCADLPGEPDARWTKVRDYASRMEGTGGEARLEYVSADVRDQVRSYMQHKSIQD